MTAKPIETAAELYRAMRARGLELRRGTGRDDAILAELRDALGCPPNGGFQAFLDGRKDLNAAVFLRAFRQAAHPFASMFQEIWDFLAKVAAAKADESIRIRVGFEDALGALDLDLEAFRQYAEIAADISKAALWSRKTLLELFEPGWDLVASLGLAPRSAHYGGGPRYDVFRDYALPVVDSRFAGLREVARGLQTAVDAVVGVKPDDPRTWLKDAGFALTDILPYWVVVLQQPDRLPAAAYQKFVDWLEDDFLPRLDRETSPAGREPIDEIDLPFWRHRWHTYEVWVSVVTIRALERARVAPRVRVVDGYLPIDGYREAVLADLTCAAAPGACLAIQVQTLIAGTQRQIRPDLRIFRSAALEAEEAVVVIECKQRKAMTLAHLNDVSSRYCAGAPNATSVIVVNYDEPGLGALEAPAHSLEAVRPRCSRRFEDLVVESLLEARLSSVLKVAVLFDCSGSMSGAYELLGLGDDAAALCELAPEMFAFSDCLLPTRPQLSGGRLVLPPREGGTNLQAALIQLIATLGRMPDLLVLVSDGGHGSPPALANLARVIERPPYKLRECVDEVLRFVSQ